MSNTSKFVKKIAILTVALSYIVLLNPYFSWAEDEIITEIEVEGNRRIESDAILSAIDSRVGGYLSKDMLSEDIKEIFKMGYFSNVKVDYSTGSIGPVLRFIVEERPFITNVELEGVEEVEEKLVKHAITVKEYTIFRKDKIKESVRKILKLYADKGFFLADVSYSLDVKNNETSLSFHINEGIKVKVKKINLMGNKQIEDDELLKIMETSPGGAFSWLTGSGKFDEDTLLKDVEVLKAFYYTKGFVQVNIGGPRVYMSPDKMWLYITVKIFEGEQFYTGKIDFKGDLAKDDEILAGLKKKLKLTSGTLFNRVDLRADIMALTDSFGDKGYAFADVSPDMDIDEEKKVVNVTFNADKGALAYIGRINITGNSKTRDKVIRREMRIDEGELYNGSALRRSRQRIFNLSFFREANLSTKKVEDNKLDIDIDVEEGPTGTFSAGVGYSSNDGTVGMLQLSQGNLFGKGQKLSINAEAGGSSRNYSISFTEPYLFDTNITAGIDLFDNSKDYVDYSTSSKGWGVRTGWPISEYGRASLRYTLKNVEISNLSEDAPEYYNDYSNTLTSSFSTNLSRDTRDNYINPSSGSKNSFNIEYASGLFGGNNYFYKTDVNSNWFFPAFSDHVIMVHGKIGFAEGLKDQDLHPDEKYFLGGMNTLRGFGYRSVGPEEDGVVVGGDKEILFNIEYLFDLAKDSGLKGLFFYDRGNAFARNESYSLTNMRNSAGYGVRWYSPIGPLRLEWGKVLDPKPGETKNRLEFSIGTFF